MSGTSASRSFDVTPSARSLPSLTRPSAFGSGDMKNCTRPAIASLSASGMRAVMSGPPPGVKPTSTRTGLSGNDAGCTNACAGYAQTTAAARLAAHTLPYRAAEDRQHLADRALELHVGDIVELRRLRVQDDDRGARRLRARDRRRDGVDLERRAHGQQAVGLFGGAHGALDHVGNKRLAEGDRVALENAPAGLARRVCVARANAIEHRLHGASPAARQANRLVQVAVHFDHALGRDARALVQAVDVLRDQRKELPGF